MPLHAALSDPCLPCGIDQIFLPPTAENDTTALLSYICAAAMVCHLAVIKSDTRADDAGIVFAGDNIHDVKTKNTGKRAGCMGSCRIFHHNLTRG